MDNRVGPGPVPADEDIAQWLQEREENHEEIVAEVLTGLEGIIDDQKQAGEPDIFAYGKLLNYLASSDVATPELVAICAAALWWLKDEIEMRMNSA